MAKVMDASNFEQLDSLWDKSERIFGRIEQNEIECMADEISSPKK
jgi:hypothetical protein